jgi:hypothetical protein
MKKTPDGTRKLLEGYLKHIRADVHIIGSTFAFAEEEIARRIGKGNSVLIDGVVVTAFISKDINGKDSPWLHVSERIRLDTSTVLPSFETPFDGVDEDVWADAECNREG